jgi:hypothetical protein
MVAYGKDGGTTMDSKALKGAVFYSKPHGDNCQGRTSLGPQVEEVCTLSFAGAFFRLVSVPMRGCHDCPAQGEAILSVRVVGMELSLCHFPYDWVHASVSFGHSTGVLQLDVMAQVLSCVQPQ